MKTPLKTLFILAISIAGMTYNFAEAACLHAPARFNTWYEFRETMPSRSAAASTITARSALAQQEWQLRQDAVAESVDRFFQNSSLMANWRCLEQSAFQFDFFNSLAPAFYERSVQLLSNSHSPRLQKFVDLLKIQNQNFSITLSPPVQDAPTQGGFHRASGSIYMNISSLRSQDWLLIFIHENLHALDQDLKDAIAIYNDEDFVRSLAACVHSENCVLDPAQSTKLHNWLLAGLSRGLLAEHRAWLLTTILYQDALAEGLLRSVPWIENLLRQRPQTETLERFLFRFLDPRFTDPNTGIYSLPLVSNQLQLLRTELKIQAPPMHGNLKEILEGN